MLRLLAISLLLVGCIAPASASSNSPTLHIATWSKLVDDASPTDQIEPVALFVAPSGGWHVRGARVLPISPLLASDTASVQLEVGVWSADHMSAVGAVLESNTTDGDWIPWGVREFADIFEDPPNLPIPVGGAVTVAQNKPLGPVLAGKYLVQVELVGP